MFLRIEVRQETDGFWAEGERLVAGPHESAEAAARAWVERAAPGVAGVRVTDMGFGHWLARVPGFGRNAFTVERRR